MIARRSPAPSQLFTVRLWAEDVGVEQAELRGTVRHVTSGETIHFRDWTVLEGFLVAIMQAHPTPPRRP